MTCWRSIPTTCARCTSLLGTSNLISKPSHALGGNMSPQPKVLGTQSFQCLEDLQSRRMRSRRATVLLVKAYGSPNHNNKQDPLDELVFIILSQMTTFPSFERVYSRLRQAAPQWDDVLVMSLRALKQIIKDAGLSNQKAPRLKAIFARLKEDFGSVTLDPLREMKTRDAEDYLVTLPGVQRKTAKCVLMYSLQRAVLPVDTHVLRVSRRLGLTMVSVCRRFSDPSTACLMCSGRLFVAVHLPSLPGSGSKPNLVAITTSLRRGVRASLAALDSPLAVAARRRFQPADKSPRRHSSIRHRFFSF